MSRDVIEHPFWREPVQEGHFSRVAFILLFFVGREVWPHDHTGGICLYVGAGLYFLYSVAEAFGRFSLWQYKRALAKDKADSLLSESSEGPVAVESRVANVLRRFKSGESMESLGQQFPSNEWVEDIVRAYMLGVDAATREVTP